MSAEESPRAERHAKEQDHIFKLKKTVYRGIKLAKEQDNRAEREVE
jgi:hypothetical protein